MRWIFAFAFVLAIPADTQGFEACASVPVYEPCEISLELAAEDLAQHANPYSDIELRAEFRSPKGGRTKVMPAFWDGGRRFRLRFSPDYEGRWDFRLISNIPAIDRRTGSFEATPARTPGFIEVFNTRYFKYPLDNSPHFWLGDTILDLGVVPWETFRAIADRRSEQGFTHMRSLALGPPETAAQVFKAPEEPWVEYFQELDRRVAYLHGLGLVTDLILGGSDGELERLFPRRRQLERYIRYICARYAAYSVTWQAALAWEGYEEGGKFFRQLGALLSKHDPYAHPKSTGADVSSAALADDEWLDYCIQNRVDPALATIEYETAPAPFVNTGVGLGADADADAVRKQAWNAAVRGHWVTLATGGETGPDSPSAEQLALLRTFFSQSRYFDLQPHYRVVGGAALALQTVSRYGETPVGIEYIVYAEEPGEIELVLPKHQYSVSWYNPADGSWLDQKKKFKGDRYRSRTPDGERDWVLYVRREGKKAGFNRSYILESKKAKLREVEYAQAEMPFEIQLPAAGELAAGEAHDFNATLRKNTIAAKRMLWLWTGEVAGSGRGLRILGSSQSGRFLVPGDLAGSYPATLSVRLVGLDGAGRLFGAFRTYPLLAPDRP